MKVFKPFLAIFLTTAAISVWASDALQTVVKQRVDGDRSGVCLVATQIGESIDHAAACANDANDRQLGADSRFEIGSLSKAMQGLVVAGLVEAGKLELDLPLSDIYPADTELPGSDDNPIRLIHLLTHTSGLPRLPANLAPADVANPYADYSGSDLMEALANTSTSTQPGETFAYSNFGAMALSHALMTHTGQPLHVLFDTYVLDPLEMGETSLGGETVQGHDSAGKAVANWDFAYNLGGVGAIRSTPADLAKWLSATLNPRGSAIEGALNRSRKELINAGGQRVGYGWLHLPLNDRFILAHDGGTGGFSSFAAVDIEREAASLVLMDTSMLMQNSLSDLAMHLIEPEFPLGQPQVPQAAAAGETLSDYVGRFAMFQGEQQFMGDFVIDFSEQSGELLLQASVNGQTQPQVPMTSEGDGRFTIESLDVTVEFSREGDGPVNSLDFSQGPLSLRGERL